MPTKLKRYNVSIPEDLLEPLEEAATRYHMPFSRIMVFLCVRGLEYEKRLEQPELSAGPLLRDSKDDKVIVFRSASQPAQAMPRTVHQR